MKKNIISSLLILIALFIFGLSLVIWAENVTNIVSIVFGCITIIYGLAILIDYIRKDIKTLNDNLKLIFGIITIVLGGILVFKTDFLKELISFIIGIYVVLTSLLKLQETMNVQKSLGIKLTKNIIISVVEIIIGVLCIFGKFIVPDFFVKFIGIMLMIYSVLGIYNQIVISKNN
ncbi:MAG: DUF308 domain-containing protein [Bacilli bacterium]|nr:DUF308 domain-containing protein [Bacilli bacterium]